MFEIFQQEKWITAAMLVLLGFSVFGRVLLGCLYGSMIRETDNMAVTQNKLLRQCKLKFINCYQLNNGVNNVSVFVDKFLSRMAVGPFSFERLYHFSGQTELLFVVVCGAGICKCIAGGKTIGQIIPFYIACFAGLYLYFSVSSAVDIKGKRRLLKIYLVDYLENHLSSRIGTTRDDLEMLHYIKPGKKTIEFMPIGKRMEVLEPQERGEEREPAPAGSPADENMIKSPWRNERGSAASGGPADENMIKSPWRNERGSAAPAGSADESMGKNLWSNERGAAASGNFAGDAGEWTGRNMNMPAGGGKWPGEPFISAAGSSCTQDSLVTEEELEALLKEFLAI